MKESRREGGAKEAPLGLYIHIPFCKEKCSYCDFLSFANGSNELMLAYTEALCKEIESPFIGRKISSVFVGGGTPTALPQEMLLKILAAIKQLPIMDDAELTIEANPGTVTAEGLKAMRKAGLNRISFGAQAMQDELLAAIGRIHRRKDVLEALDWAKETGFEHINVDLMLGLPGQDEKMLEESIRQLADKVDHMSVYALILEEDTPLYQRVLTGETRLPDEDDVAKMLDFCEDFLPELGFKQYEISNYCKPGAQCKHNLNYWRVGEYLACGLGASGALREGKKLLRTKNETDIKRYIDEIQKGKSVCYLEETVDLEGQAFEAVMLGLRLNEGISLREFESRFGFALEDRYAEAILQNEEKGWVYEEQGRIKLSREGRRMQNTLLLDFMD